MLAAAETCDESLACSRALKPCENFGAALCSPEQHIYEKHTVLTTDTQTHTRTLARTQVQARKHTQASARMHSRYSTYLDLQLPACLFALVEHPPELEYLLLMFALHRIDLFHIPEAAASASKSNKSTRRSGSEASTSLSHCLDLTSECPLQHLL